MATLLKPAIQKILKFFYSNKAEDFHLREISRKTGLEGQSIVKTLRLLEKNKILSFKRQGNQKRYFLKNTKETYAMLSIFDCQKLESLPLLRKNAIDVYLENLPEPPIFAVVFGSTVSGNFRENSDIDILIVTNNHLNVKDAENKAAALSAMDIHSFQIIYSDFIKELKLKEDYVIQSAIFSGFPVVNHIPYYRITHDERSRAYTTNGK